ncbi:sugar ABC transporter permease [Dolosigranulum pigrum]|uniref:ABC transmembrane type-1 domain-containing protein n=4 Tax=Carnobacteriaceae TaxID=186828 RepID=H3NDE8_9LACT|nr:sugar ABC transporter permease [Dolosigranulum pigrum]EHR34367.1 hypothetical protein HMPREF9703_00638 [Dolosigranulum pigrum ATCC 51524]QJS95820.1 sugar ABC transporter permease [Dolosigranulum pigrum]QTJ33625.1 sugar ABC transporter permease [Dolosigranulum pigrum]QTJ35268.1 sugar ABC transporter permease [Dolosigranulum pigrum]QTJ37020.1 sugar ABC transporter permease [Dolosigranulum pigrum]
MVEEKGFTRWIFVLPAMIMVLALFLYPALSSVFYSFTNKHLTIPGYDIVGFDNYKAILSDAGFWRAFLNSLKWTIYSLVGQVLTGFFLALCLNRIKKFRGLYRILLIIPWAFPTIVIAFSWQWILNGVYGFLPNLIVELGILEHTPAFLTDSTWAFISLVFINIWFGTPLMMVNILSALQTVPAEQYEAAEMDGASKWQQFKHITFPHIRIVIGLLVVLRTVWIFNNFDIIYLITGGGPGGSTMSLPIYAYEMGWGTQLIGRSSAVTVLLFVFLLAVSFLYFKVIAGWEKERG